MKKIRDYFFTDGLAGTIRQIKFLIVVTIFAAFIFGFCVGKASAHTTIIGPPKYQRWVDESKMPTPDVTITVSHQTCADTPQFPVIACTLPQYLWIHIDEAYGLPGEKQVFFHELGHNFDYYNLDDPARSIFLSLMEISYGWKDRPVADNSWVSPIEVFANTYSNCARYGLMTPHHSRVIIRPFVANAISDKSRIGFTRLNKLCLLMRRYN